MWKKIIEFYNCTRPPGIKMLKKQCYTLDCENDRIWRLPTFWSLRACASSLYDSCVLRFQQQSITVALFSHRCFFFFHYYWNRFYIPIFISLYLKFYFGAFIILCIFMFVRNFLFCFVFKSHFFQPNNAIPLS